MAKEAPFSLWAASRRARPADPQTRRSERGELFRIEPQQLFAQLQVAGDLGIEIGCVEHRGRRMGRALARRRRAGHDFGGFPGLS